MEKRRKRVVALLLNGLVGCFGFHRLYLGHYVSGTLYFLMGLGLWGCQDESVCFALRSLLVICNIIDFYRILFGLMTDGRGERIDW